MSSVLPVNRLYCSLHIVIDFIAPLANYRNQPAIMLIELVGIKYIILHKHHTRSAKIFSVSEDRPTGLSHQ